MKKIVALGILASLTLSAMGQGQVQFNNRVTSAVPPVDAKIYLDSIAGGVACNGTDTSFRAALLGGAVGSTAASSAGAGTLNLLASPSTAATWVNFRTGAAAGYVNVGADSGRDSGLAYGSQGVFQLVAWQGNYTTWQAAYAAALVNPAVKVGWSNPLTLPTSLNASDPNVPTLSGLTSFAITSVPEPSTMALAGLGAAALLIFRRRK